MKGSGVQVTSFGIADDAASAYAMLPKLRAADLDLVFCHMLDMQTDHAALTAAFGCHIVQTEADELLKLERTVTKEEIEGKKGEILNLFDTPAPKSDPITETLTEEDLQVSARVAVALDTFIDTHNLDGLAYYYEGQEGSPMRELVTNLTVGNSLLTAAGPRLSSQKARVCTAPYPLRAIPIPGDSSDLRSAPFSKNGWLKGRPIILRSALVTMPTLFNRSPKYWIWKVSLSHLRISENEIR